MTVVNLTRPIHLGPGAKLQDLIIRVSEDFVWDPTAAIIYAKGADITISHVEIIGSPMWQRRWNNYNPTVKTVGDPPGIPLNTCGVRFQGGERLKLSSVTVSGLPGHGVTLFGADSARIAGLQVNHCFHGLTSTTEATSSGVLVEDCHFRNLWGPPPRSWPGIEGAPSNQRPGGWMGGDGIAMGGLRNAIVRNCTTKGEQNGSFKFVNPQGLLVANCEGISMMIQGTTDELPGAEIPASSIVIRECLIDKSFGEGRVAQDGNGIQLSRNITDVLVTECTIASGGENGHGAECAVNVNARFTNNTFIQWNGTRGGQPAYAIAPTLNSTVNPDCEQTNIFIDQDRRLYRGA